jgi:uncharacterized protein
MRHRLDLARAQHARRSQGANLPGRLTLTAALGLCGALAPLSPAAADAVSLLPSYTQSFDGLAATGSAIAWVDDQTLAGWYATRTTYNANTGSANTGALYSYGASEASERALGSLASGGTQTVVYGVRLRNDSASAIDSLTVRYRGEQWRDGGSTTTASLPQRLALSYRVGGTDLTSGSWTEVAALDFTSPVAGTVTPRALDGNAAANAVVVSGSLTNLALAPGQELWLRWSDANDANNDHGLAIDDLRVEAATTPDQPEVPSDCSASDTPIGTVQGAGESAALTGNVTIQGVVVGDFEGASPALRGFYVQDSGDADPATSDAIFVFTAGQDRVQLGDEVQLTGAVAEFQGQTQLSSVEQLTLCARGRTVTPTALTLPVPELAFLERYEGMLVSFAQTLHVTEHFQLGRFGQVTLAADARLAQPTNVAQPGAAARAIQAQNDRSRIIVDDALQSQNPDPIVFGRGGQPLSAANTLRGGDTVSGLTGVLTYTWAGNAASGNAYRVRPIGSLGASVPNFVASNPRPTTAPAVAGELKVASFNLLNYFNTFGNACSFGVGGAVAECRGAESASEFERQSNKTVQALAALDADIVGVIEIENDGYGPGSAIVELVDRLNLTVGAGTYAFVDVDARTGRLNAAGDDAIKVGLLYRPSKVQPVANHTHADSNPVHNRAPVLQTFEDARGARLTVVVNHFKSKGCDGASGADLDQGDGQGCFNATRVAQASALVDFMDELRATSGDPDELVIGDLNSYAKEEPIQVLEAAAYTNLIAASAGAAAYSYAFDGQWGYLDHALASPSLRTQVSGAAELHINADEPSVLDYNTNFKTEGQRAALYAADRYRTSDHDPVLVGVSLAAPIVPFGRLTESLDAVNAGSALPIEFSAGGDLGLSILAAGSPSSREVDCATSAPKGDAATITTPGQSGLAYDAASGRYTIVWKTDRSFAGTCRSLTLTLTQGSMYSTVVRFR